MTEQEVLKVLEGVGAIIRNTHVLLRSGLHGDSYVNKDAIYPYTRTTSQLCRAIAEQFLEDDPEVVIAPAIGGVILSQWVAFMLTRLAMQQRLTQKDVRSTAIFAGNVIVVGALRKEVLGVYAEKSTDGETFVIKRGYDKLIPGKRVLVVEDVVTTGGSARKVMDAVRALGGEVIGLGVLCNRGGVTPKDVGDVPKLVSLVNVKSNTWGPQECPLCAQKIPFNMEVGKARELGLSIPK